MDVSVRSGRSDAPGRISARAAAILSGLVVGMLAQSAPAGAAEGIRGAVLGPGKQPVVGAIVTFQRGTPAHRVSVFTDERGIFQTPPLAGAGPTTVIARRIGWNTVRREDIPLEDGQWLRLDVSPTEDPLEVAAQLPANRWFDLLLARLDDPDEREEFVRQCTYCHQQGNWATRRQRDPEEWRKILHLMGRMGGLLSRDLREKLPALLNEAYDPNHAAAALGVGEPGFAPPPPSEVRKAVVEEWDLGGRASMQHDMLVHPDGRIYSVDMTQDQLYRLTPETGAREAWSIPHGDLPLGGVFASAGPPMVPNANAHVGPHSLQVAPDGNVWITLALGNQLARFDVETETFTTVTLEEGFYPHTLRFDLRGRIWYTIAASNHLGMYDPHTEERRELRLPARTFGQAFAMRMMPLALWIGRHVDLRGTAADGDGFTAPIPYGIDVAPNGAVWFSQLNEHRIGRIDPDSFAIEMVETPFTAPRRLRFDDEGMLWIPGFSSGVLARFDPETREFREYPLPIEPAGTETPYALHVHRPSGDVWICGTNSDTLIRFVPETETFTVFPLPTRVTYTREIDFDDEGRVWTSNSNQPTWQIEGGTPRLLRLDPRGVPDPDYARQEGTRR
ncbi:MAG: carboxypeptidase regulatory-like domain-containing protein [Myxococcota bacterium]